MIKSLLGAFRTLTRFPLPHQAMEREERTLFWFPFVGAFLGLFSVGISFLPLPPSVLSALMIATCAYLTRGFHLDGLCDFADGLGGGWTKERALAIMKDSHSGAFALIVLCCTLLIQYAALQSLMQIRLALVLVPSFGRLMQVLAAATMDYARSGEGTASALVRSARKRHALVAGVQLTLLFVALFFLVPENLFISSLASVCSAFMLALVVMHIAQKRLGGVTGDVLGAIEVLAETAAMVGFLIPLA